MVTEKQYVTLSHHHHLVTITSSLSIDLDIRFAN